MKRLIAFSSVAHMGFVMLGISTLTTFGINAALFGMVAHGLITGMLFFLAGSVKHRFHTLEIKRLGGMLIQMPKLGWILGFCAMASLGLPGLAGFWGEFPAILSAYSPGFGPQRAAVPHADGARRGRHRVRRRATCCGCTSAPRSATVPTELTGGGHAAHAVGAAVNDEHHEPTSTTSRIIEWIAWTPMLIADRRARRLPAAAVQDLRPRRRPSSSTTSATSSSDRDREPPRPGRRLVGADDRLARDRARDRS